MDMHTRTVIANQWFWHERGSQAVHVCNIVYAVFIDLNRITLIHQRVVPDADLALSCSTHLVVMFFNIQSHVGHRLAHGGSQIVHRIHRRYREVSALDCGTMSQVGSFLKTHGRTPGTLIRVDFVEHAIHFIAPAHPIEDKEFEFRTEVCGASNAAGNQVILGILADASRTFVVTLTGNRYYDVTTHDQGSFLHKGVEHSRIRIRHQAHI